MPTTEYEGFKYANYPFGYLYQDHNGSKGTKKIHQIIFGDWVGILKPKNTDGDYIYVRVRGENGWMHQNDLLDERVLEIVFVDVGQGDGALVVTPNDEHIIIDTGVGDNMWRYLKWRYNGFKTKWHFQYAMATHPDEDHFGGFHFLAGEPNVFFRDYLHNGLLEYQKNIKPSDFGDIVENGRTYYTDLFDSKQKVMEYLDHKANWEHPTMPQHNKGYSELLKRLLDNDKIENEIHMVSTESGYLKGYEQNKEPNIKILGPITETVNGKKALRRLGNKAKTKNGHSIVLKLNYKDIAILLGGDLNSVAEKFLMESHTGKEIKFTGPDKEEKKAAFIAAARPIFASDIAKACHHGSADFTTLFLQCVNTSTTVISSGDEESYSHPKPEALGTMGAHSRGKRPLIFSTELARSHREDERVTVNEIHELELKLETETSATKRLKLLEKIQEKLEKLKERNVTVYGSINV